METLRRVKLLVMTPMGCRGDCGDGG